MTNSISLIKQSYKYHEGKYPSITDEHFIKKYYDSILDKTESLNEIKNKEDKIISKTTEKLFSNFPQFKSQELEKEVSENLRFLFREACLSSLRENQESLKNKFSETFKMFNEMDLEHEFILEAFFLLKKNARDELSYKSFLYIENSLSLFNMERINISNSIVDKIDIIVNNTNQKIYKKYPDMLLKDPDMEYSKRDLSLILNQALLCMINNNVGLFKDQISLLFDLFQNLKMNNDLIKDTMTVLKDVCRNELSSYEFLYLEKILDIAQYEHFYNYKKSQINQGKIKEFIKENLGNNSIENEKIYTEHIVENISLNILNNDLSNFKTFLLNTYSDLLKNSLNESSIQNYFNLIVLAFNDNSNPEILSLLQPSLKMIEVKRIKIAQTIEDRKENIIRQTNDRAYLKYPKMLKNSQDKNKSLGLRDIRIILDECVLSMMSSREDILKQKMDYFARLFANINFDTGFLADTFQMLDESLLRDLPPDVYTAIQPHIKIVKDSLSLDTKSINR